MELEPCISEAMICAFIQLLSNATFGNRSRCKWGCRTESGGSEHHALQLGSNGGTAGLSTGAKNLIGGGDGERRKSRPRRAVEEEAEHCSFAADRMDFQVD